MNTGRISPQKTERYHYSLSVLSIATFMYEIGRGSGEYDEKLKPLTGVWIMINRAGKLSVRRTNSQTHEIKELKVVFEKLRCTKFHNHKQGLH